MSVDILRHKTSTLLSRSWVKWLLGLGVFLLVLPELIRFALIQFLPNTGVGNVEIKDVDFNLFAASAGVEGLVITRDDITRLELDRAALNVRWLKLLLAEVHLEEVVIDGLRMPITQQGDGPWNIVVPLPAGDSEAAVEEDSTTGSEATVLPKVLVSTLDIKNVAIDVDSDLVAGTLAIDELVMEKASSWLKTSSTLTIRARWDDAPINLTLTARPWIDTPEASGELNIDAYDLASLSSLLGMPISGSVDMALEFNLTESATSYAASIPVELTVRDVKTAYKSVALEHAELTWAGVVELGLHPREEQVVTYALSGDISSKGLGIRDNKQSVQLLKWESIAVDDFSLDQTLTLGFKQLDIKNIDALDMGDDQDRLFTEAISVSELALTEGKQLQVKAATITGGQYDIEITPEGTLQAENVIDQLLASLQDDPAQEGAGEAEPAAEATSEPFVFSIDTLTVTGDTQVALVDRRFTPAVKQQWIIKELMLEQLDQRNPDKETTLALKSALGEFGALNVTGSMKPFKQPMMLDLEGEINAVELPDLSPYSEAYLGYHLTRGQYDHSFDLNIDNEEIDLKNTLVLRQLELESVDSDKPQPIEKQLDVPLGLALDMLRDGDNNIELKVPIKGRLDDPDININSVINKALAKAVRNGATSYLKFALQPYGAVLMAADFVGDQINTVRLDPVEFDVASDTLPATPEYIEKLLALLTDRPALELTLCGRSNEQDKNALLLKVEGPEAKVEAALNQLAEQRAKHLKRVFIDQGVGSNRLLLCQPRYEADGIHGVQLQM